MGQEKTSGRVVPTGLSQAETVELGSVHEGAGPQDIAQKDHP
jgi:hypothetical protein